MVPFMPVPHHLPARSPVETDTLQVNVGPAPGAEGSSELAAEPGLELHLRWKEAFFCLLGNSSANKGRPSRLREA